MIYKLFKYFILKIISIFNILAPSGRYRSRYLLKVLLNKEKVSIVDVGSVGGYIDNWKNSSIDKTLSFDPIDNRTGNDKNIISKHAIWESNQKINLYYINGGGTESRFIWLF
jgi:hypothetical protein